MTKIIKSDQRLFAPIIRFGTPAKRLDARQLSKDVLVLLAAGCLITSLFISPNASGALAKILQPLLTEKWRGKRVLQRLRRLKYVRIEKRDGQAFLVLTKLGKKISRRVGFERIEITRPKHWDKRWRILVFDIPERKRMERDILRAKIRQLGFREFQRSVWVLPWPCQQEIEYIIELYSLEYFVGFWEVVDGREFFRLRQKFAIE